MNSLSEYHFNEETHSIKQPDKCKNCFNGLIPGKAILRCNKSNFGTTKILLLTPPFVQTFNQAVASVTIDTTCMHCPKISIDFVGTLTNPAAFLTFSFTLFKNCKGSSFRQSVATFNYNILNFFNGFESQTLKFKHLTCHDQCDACCTYTLELTSVSSPFGVGSLFSIDGMLCALAVDSGECNCR